VTSEVLDLGERRFQMWAYSVSHSLLLLRSVKTAVHSSRIDLLFTGVSFIQPSVPTYVRQSTCRD
jgi:hypothetical protein